MQKNIILHQTTSNTLNHRYLQSFSKNIFYNYKVFRLFKIEGWEISPILLNFVFKFK
ncbi:hypothetical protein HMPREF0653_00263 [Prevotella disiens JCM 6334 = ATCC 29426]|uniref:Uncharacterized protein n=1 Tax=Prevotella disiens JCM 6334 = ATCC 29426 TaxID=1235811 RepID=A0ABN0NV81_9BACT|nr:hypothetical protein HMPREF0653_00263 [Prevotella disiens JCM 6334 = ATCC 29426]